MGELHYHLPWVKLHVGWGWLLNQVVWRHQLTAVFPSRLILFLSSCFIDTYPSSAFVSFASSSQLWIPVASYVLIAILKKRLLINASLHVILQVLSLILFEKTPHSTGLRRTRVPRKITAIF